MAYARQLPDYSDPKFEEYKKALLALSPINSNEKADAYRALFEEFHGCSLSCPNDTEQ
jgi:hypothetical protein